MKSLSSSGREELSLSALIQACYPYFSTQFPIPKKHQATGKPSLLDCILAGLAVFHLKFSSLLQYDQQCRKITGSNLKTLYRVQNPPCDTTLRERLDELSPKSLRGIFKILFAFAQRGKILESYLFWNQHYLLSVDGSGHHTSSKVFCDNCCVKQLESGQKIYYHPVLCGVLVHPHQKQVIPLAPEAVQKSEILAKNDCEQRAAERLLRDFRREHPNLKAVVTEDGLYAAGKHLELLQELDLKFIIIAKPGNLRLLYDWIESSLLTGVVRCHAGVTQRYRFLNQVPLNDTFFERKVNFLEYDEINAQGKKQHFAWITDLPLSESTLETVMRGAERVGGLKTKRLTR
ncbi:MAG: hypothetical protein I8H75_05000 [Myxococcaceae bacterium]|nr:hypothetical protein [Myxococcaceae bacterium]